MIRTAVIGFGLSAQTFHLPFLGVSADFEIVAISTRQKEAAQAAYPAAHIFAEANELLRRCEADLVIITAPNAFHFSLAEQALKRGLHVVLEKPFVNTVDEGLRLIHLAQTQQRVLSVFHNRRWDGDFLTVINLLQTQSVGTLHAFHSHFDRFRPQTQSRWRELPGPGTGTWFDLGSHLLDQALCLFGLPQAISARCLKMREGAQVNDYFHVNLHYPQLEVYLHGSPFSAGSPLRFLLEGSQGSYRKYGLDPQEEKLKRGHNPEQTDWGQEEAEAWGILYQAGQQRVIPTFAGAYQQYFSRLAAAIQEAAPIPVPARDALQVIALLNLAENSSQQGKTLALQPDFLEGLNRSPH